MSKLTKQNESFLALYNNSLFCHSERSERICINHSKSITYTDSFAALRMTKDHFIFYFVTILKKMSDLELKNKIILQLAKQNNTSKDDVEASLVDMILAKNKSELIDFFNKKEAQEAVILKALDAQKVLEDELQYFLVSAYEDFKKYPFPKPLESTFSEPINQDKIPLVIDLEEPDEPKNAPSESVEKEDYLAEVIVSEKKISPSKSTTYAPKPTPPPFKKTLPNTPNLTDDMRFENHNFTPPPPPPPPIKKFYFDNGEEGKDYQYSIDWLKLELLNVGKHWFENLEEYGLKYDESMGFLSGSPNRTGELALKFFYQTKDDTAKTIECLVLIFIKPDTRKMFERQVEPDPSLPYQKDHLEKYAIHEGEKTLVGASRRGRSHAMDGKFRDDDMELVYQPKDGWYILAVADGAGSAKYAREGSKIACDTALDVIRNSGKLTELDNFLQNFSQNTEGPLSGIKDVQGFKNLVYNLLGLTAHEAHKAINKASEAMEDSHPKDFSTTFLLSIVKKYDDEWFIGSFWVGDGGICIYFDDKEPIVMGTPDSGEFSGQTRFLTMSDIFADYETIAKRIAVEFVTDFKLLALMTDGVTDALFQTEANLERKEIWDAFYQNLTSEVTLSKDNAAISDELLTWLNFWVKGEYDDRTIALLF
jgi:serine/threonine protein phosphatase PrpC